MRWANLGDLYAEGRQTSLVKNVALPSHRAAETVALKYDASAIAGPS
jgi:hypothetical protein